MVSGLLPSNTGPYSQHPTKVFRKWHLIKDEILETNKFCRPERTITLKIICSTNWQLQNSPRDVKYSIGNIGNNIIITMCGVRLMLYLLGGSLCKLYKCLPTMLYT